MQPRGKSRTPMLYEFTPRQRVLFRVAVTGAALIAMWAVGLIRFGGARIVH